MGNKPAHRWQQSVENDMQVKRSRRRTVRLMFVDDHPGFGEAVKRLLAPFEAEFGKSAESSAAVSKRPPPEPEIVLVDIPLQGSNCLSATAEIRTAFPDARVFMVAEHEDPALRRAASQVGADGYLLKNDPWHLHLSTNSTSAE